MSGSHGDRLRDAFEEALAVPAADRAAFIQRRHAAEPDLGRELLAMIRHLDSESSFLEPLEATDVRALLGRGSDSSEWPGEAPPSLEGARFAGRYVLGSPLGVGGAGVVYEALDTLLGVPVAVKVMRARGAGSRIAVRREAAALRLLRLPGIVQLRDEGVEGDLPFLVTERVDGLPFPGREGRQTWSDLAEPFTALLESLERMHRAGIVHGDLKPGNVLVGADLVPVILDLGIAEGPRAAWRESRDGARRGTWRYVAPEQAAQGEVTARADLYAVGIMLYEALVGKPFRSQPTVAQLRIGIVREQRVRATELEATAPRRVLALLERLLAPEPERRPESAAAALAELRVRSRPARSGGDLPGDVGIADPRYPSPEALEGLFAGTDRLWHLREDAAVALWRRTGGDREAVAEELEAWRRAGLGWWEGNRYHIRRRDLDTLERGLQSHVSARAPQLVEVVLSPFECDLVSVVELAGARATAALLAEVLDASPPQVRRTVESLRSRGVLLAEDGDLVRLAVLPIASRRHVAHRAASLHRRIARALPRGDERRLLHWVAAGSVEIVPAESVAVAEALLADGDLPGARTAIAEGLGALELRPDPDWTVRLLELNLSAAIQLGTKDAYDQHLYVERRFPMDPRLERLDAIAQAGLHVVEGQPERALEELPPPEGAESDGERRCGVSALLFAARRVGGATFVHAVERVERLAAETSSPLVQAAAASARGWLLYGEDRYEEAGQSHLAAARATPLAAARVSARLNAASAFLEAGAFHRAIELALEALEHARARRHPVIEARAERVVRAAAYRRGDSLSPDEELVAAASGLGQPHLAALLALNEAAVAWRAGRRECARGLARQAAEGWRGEPGRWPRMLARALAAAASAVPDAAELEELLAECRLCPAPSLAAQTAGLLARAWPERADVCRALASAHAAGVPEALRSIRLEILSLPEAVKSTPR